jgi:hypothetical protein
MDGTSASLERIKALWQQLERATPGSPEYDAIAKQISHRIRRVQRTHRGGEEESARKTRGLS